MLAWPISGAGVAKSAATAQGAVPRLSDADQGHGNGIINLVGGLVAMFYFPRNIGCLIIPIDELIFFRGLALAHQPETDRKQTCGFPQLYHDEKLGTNKIYRYGRYGSNIGEAILDIIPMFVHCIRKQSTLWISQTKMWFQVSTTKECDVKRFVVSD